MRKRENKIIKKNEKQIEKQQQQQKKNLREGGPAKSGLTSDPRRRRAGIMQKHEHFHYKHNTLHSKRGRARARQPSRPGAPPTHCPLGADCF